MKTNNYFKVTRDRVSSFFFFDLFDVRSRSGAWEAALAMAGGDSTRVSVYRRHILPPGNKAHIIGEPK